MSNKTKEPGSISTAIMLLAAGSEYAQELIFARYFSRLEHAAEFRLRGGRPGDRDPQAAALSAFRTVFRDAENGQLPASIRDREGLLRFLLFKMGEKAIQQYRRERRVKHGAGMVVSEADINPATDKTFQEWVQSHEPTPEELEVRRRLDAMVDAVKQTLPERQQRFLECELLGYTTNETMQAIDVSRATITVYRREVRLKIQQALDDSSTD
jgi:DNA-directed RNA polymerase specialized sigma24 family protein